MCWALLDCIRFDIFINKIYLRERDTNEIVVVESRDGNGSNNNKKSLIKRTTKIQRRKFLKKVIFIIIINSQRFELLYFIVLERGQARQINIGGIEKYFVEII